MGKRKTNSNVTREEATRMLEEFTQSNTDSLTGDIEKSDCVIAIIKFAQSYLLSIRNGDFCEIPSICIPKNDGTKEPYDTGYFKNVRNPLNTVLLRLCRRLKDSENPGKFASGYITAGFKNQGKMIILKWEEHKVVEPLSLELLNHEPERPRRKVIMLGRLLNTPFSTDLMRGARSMARELGADMIDQRTKDGISSESDITKILNISNKQEYGIVFYFMDITGHNKDYVEAISSQFSSIHAGLDRVGSISIKYTESAEMLIQQLAKRAESEGLPPNPKILLLEIEGLEDSHPLAVRQVAYRKHFKNIIMRKPTNKLVLESILIDKYNYDHDNDSVNDNEISKINKNIHEDKSESIFAILSRSHRITSDIIRLVINNGRHKGNSECNHNIYVYGENITTDLLASLNDQNDPLDAVCSADPYYMGRYITRAIIKEIKYHEEHPGAGDHQFKHEKIPPVLITKDYVKKHGKLQTIDRLPDVLVDDDVRLDGDAFAWELWMKEPCPHSFGPSFRKRQPEEFLLKHEPPSPSKGS